MILLKLPVHMSRNVNVKVGFDKYIYIYIIYIYIYIRYLSMYLTAHWSSG